MQVSSRLSEPRTLRLLPGRPPARRPLPSSQTATCVAGAWGGSHVSIPGLVWQQLLRREPEPTGGGGASRSPPPSPSPQSGAAGSLAGRTWVAGPGPRLYFEPPPPRRALRGARARRRAFSSSDRAGRRDPADLRNRLSGGGGREPSPLRCAALAGCAEAPRAASGRPPAPAGPSGPLRLAARGPARAGCPACPRPFPAVASRPSCSPGRGTALGSRSLQRGGGRFRPPRPGCSRRCHGARHLLRGAASRGVRAGHPFPRARGPRGSPALAARRRGRPAPPARGPSADPGEGPPGGRLVTGLFCSRFPILRLHLYLHLRRRPQKVFVWSCFISCSHACVSFVLSVVRVWCFSSSFFLFLSLLFLPFNHIPSPRSSDLKSRGEIHRFDPGVSKIRPQAGSRAAPFTPKL